MARMICARPCLENASWKIPLPMPATGKDFGITGGTDINLAASCDGCQISIRLLLQIQPFLLSLQMPLCIFKCIFALFGCVRKIAGPKSVTVSVPGLPTFKLMKDLKPFIDFEKVMPDVINVTSIEGIVEALPLLNITKEVLIKTDDPEDPAVLERFEQVVLRCQCLFNWLEPFKWVCMIKGIILLLISVMNCITSILQHGLIVSIQIAGLATNPSLEIRETAQCLEGIMQNQMTNLAGRLNAFGMLLELTAFIIETIDDVGILGALESTPGGGASVVAIRKLPPILESLANGGDGGATKGIKQLMDSLKDMKVIGTVIADVSILRCTLETTYCMLDSFTSNICAMPYTTKDSCADLMGDPNYCKDKYSV